MNQLHVCIHAAMPFQVSLWPSFGDGEGDGTGDGSDGAGEGAGEGAGDSAASFCTVRFCSPSCAEIYFLKNVYIWSADPTRDEWGAAWVKLSLPDYTSPTPPELGRKSVKCIDFLLTGDSPPLAREFKHGPQMVPGSNPRLVPELRFSDVFRVFFEDVLVFF